MPRRRGTNAVPLVVAALIAVTIAATLALLTPSGTATAFPPTPATSDEVSDPADGGREPLPTTTINEFIPENRDLSDCLSVLPKPGCGSEARGGAAQTAVFGAMLLGIGVIGVRIAWSIRARDRARNSGTENAESDADDHRATR